MARPLRICLPGGVYHVVARGNDRGLVFRDDLDRTALLAGVEQAVGRFAWLCHAYCLLGNHYHLLVETPRPNLPVGMRQVNGVYAQRFNRRHGRKGHVFESRYRAVLVQKATHLAEICRYIVLNPVRAGLVADPADWHWSSYRATAGLGRAPRWLTTSWVLGQFGSRERRAQAAFEAFVAEGLEAPVPEPRGERIGDDVFLRETFGIDPPLPEIPREQVQPLPPSLDEIFGDDKSAAAVAVAYRRHGYTLREIGDYVGRHYSTVSRRLRDEETGRCSMRERKT